MLRGDSLLAQKMLLSSIENYKTYILGLVSLGIYYRYVNDMNKSRMYFERTIKVWPLLIESEIWRHCLDWFGSDCLDQLIKKSIEFYESSPLDNPHDKARLGHLYFYTNQYNLAQIMYRQAIDELPYLSGSHMNLGRVYLQEGKLDLAHKEVTYSKIGNFPPAYFWLGIIYQSKNNSEAATFFFNQYKRTFIHVDPETHSFWERSIYKIKPLTNTTIPPDLKSQVFPSF